MNSNKIDFQTEKLQVDYLAVKLEDEMDGSMIKNMQHEFQQKFKYKSYSKYDDLDISNPKFRLNNFDSIYFKVLVKPTWRGLIIHFPGKVANNFYTYIKIHGIPWHIFKIPKQRITLSRIDVCYVKPITNWTSSLEQELLHFFNHSAEKPINKTTHIIKHQNGGRELIICRRDSGSFYRVYSYPEGLKFELELKRKYHMTSLQSLLLQNQIADFENQISVFFEKQWGRRLFLDTDFTTWLVKINRVRFPKQKYLPTKTLLSTYLTPYRSDFSEAYYLTQKMYKRLNNTDFNEPWLFTDDEAFYSLLQLCSFISISMKKEPRDYEEYSSVEFPLTQFFKFIGMKKITQSKRKKFATFFKILPYATPILQEFDDESFLSAIAIPFVLVYKISNQWMVRIKIQNSFLDYTHPFSHSFYFINWKDKHDLRVKVMILQSFNTYSVEKVIPIANILQQYREQSGGNKKLVKLYILECLQELGNNCYIYNQVRLINKQGINQTLSIKKLTLKHLAQSNIIYMKEII